MKGRVLLFALVCAVIILRSGTFDRRESAGIARTPIFIEPEHSNNEEGTLVTTDEDDAKAKSARATREETTPHDGRRSHNVLSQEFVSLQNSVCYSQIACEVEQQAPTLFSFDSTAQVRRAATLQRGSVTQHSSSDCNQLRNIFSTMLAASSDHYFHTAAQKEQVETFSKVASRLVVCPSIRNDMFYAPASFRVPLRHSEHRLLKEEIVPCQQQQSQSESSPTWQLFSFPTYDVFPSSCFAWEEYLQLSLLHLVPSNNNANQQRRIPLLGVAECLNECLRYVGCVGFAHALFSNNKKEKGEERQFRVVCSLRRCKNTVTEFPATGGGGGGGKSGGKRRAGSSAAVLYPLLNNTAELSPYFNKDTKDDSSSETTSKPEFNCKTSNTNNNNKRTPLFSVCGAKKEDDTDSSRRSSSASCFRAVGNPRVFHISHAREWLPAPQLGAALKSSKFEPTVPSSSTSHEHQFKSSKSNSSSPLSAKIRFASIYDRKPSLPSRSSTATKNDVELFVTILQAPPLFIHLHTKKDKNSSSSSSRLLPAEYSAARRAPDPFTPVTHPHEVAYQQQFVASPAEPNRNKKDKEDSSFFYARHKHTFDGSLLAATHDENGEEEALQDGTGRLCVGLFRVRSGNNPQQQQHEEEGSNDHARRVVPSSPWWLTSRPNVDRLLCAPDDELSSPPYDAAVGELLSSTGKKTKSNYIDPIRDLEHVASIPAVAGKSARGRKWHMFGDVVSPLVAAHVKSSPNARQTLLRGVMLLFSSGEDTSSCRSATKVSNSSSAKELVRHYCEGISTSLTAKQGGKAVVGTARLVTASLGGEEGGASEPKRIRIANAGGFNVYPIRTASFRKKSAMCRLAGLAAFVSSSKSTKSISLITSALLENSVVRATAALQPASSSSSSVSPADAGGVARFVGGDTAFIAAGVARFSHGILEISNFSDEAATERPRQQQLEVNVTLVINPQKRTKNGPDLGYLGLPFDFVSSDSIRLSAEHTQKILRECHATPTTVVSPTQNMSSAPTTATKRDTTNFGPILISEPVHECAECIQNQLQNFHHFIYPSIVVLHTALFFKLNPSQKKAIELAHPSVHFNPSSVDTMRGLRLLFAHVLNLHYAIHIRNFSFSHVVFAASNEMYVRHGALEYIRRHDAVWMDRPPDPRAGLAYEHNLDRFYQMNNFEFVSMDEFLLDFPNIWAFTMKSVLQRDHWLARFAGRRRLKQQQQYDDEDDDGAENNKTISGRRRNRRRGIESLRSKQYPTSYVFMEGTFLRKHIASEFIRDVLAVYDPRTFIDDPMAYPNSEVYLATALQDVCYRYYPDAADDDDEDEGRRNKNKNNKNKNKKRRRRRRRVKCGFRVSSMTWANVAPDHWMATLSDVQRVQSTPFEVPFALKRISRRSNDPLRRYISNLSLFV